MDEVIRAATMITVLLCLLSILHSSGEVHNELFGHDFNAIWVFVIDVFLLLGTLFLQVCHPCGGCCGWLAAFEPSAEGRSSTLGLLVLVMGGF